MTRAMAGALRLTVLDDGCAAFPEGTSTDTVATIPSSAIDAGVSNRLAARASRFELQSARRPRARLMTAGARLARGGAGLALTFGLLLSVVAPASALASLPNPCSIVPGAVIASAFGVRTPPSATFASVPKVSTCAYGHGQLTVAVGFTVLGNPALPLRVVSVPGLPHGKYETYAGTTQSELIFVEGSTATGIYGVVRNYARIPESKLIKVAQALASALTSSNATPGADTQPGATTTS